MNKIYCFAGPNCLEKDTLLNTVFEAGEELVLKNPKNLEQSIKEVREQLTKSKLFVAEPSDEMNIVLSELENWLVVDIFVSIPLFQHLKHLRETGRDISGGMAAYREQLSMAEYYDAEIDSEDGIALMIEKLEEIIEWHATVGSDEIVR